MRAVVSLAILAFVLITCTPKNPSSEQPLRLVVAASLGPAALELASQLEKSHGLKVQVHAGASSLIARQIVGGLQCDVVVTADDEWMDFLAKNDAIEKSTRYDFLGNQLVLIANRHKSKELVDSRRIAMADPEHVPAGKYAKAALMQLGLWEQNAAKVVSAPDVRTALLWVERGEVDTGIVYETDAMSSSNVVVKSVFARNGTHPIRYPVAQCLSKNTRAKELYRLVTATYGSKIFRKFGFQIVTPHHDPA